MNCYILTRANKDEGIEVMASDIQRSIGAIITQWIDPKEGFLPDNIENVAESFPEGTPIEEIRAEAIKRTKERFGIGVPKDTEHYSSEEYLFLAVGLGTGIVEEVGTGIIEEVGTV